MACGLERFALIWVHPRPRVEGLLAESRRSWLGSDRWCPCPRLRRLAIGAWVGGNGARWLLAELRVVGLSWFIPSPARGPLRLCVGSCGVRPRGGIASSTSRVPLDEFHGCRVMFNSELRGVTSSHSRYVQRHPIRSRLIAARTSRTRAGAWSDTGVGQVNRRGPGDSLGLHTGHSGRVVIGRCPSGTCCAA